MHPAASVILFTTLSGTGYGLLWWICFAQLLTPHTSRPVLVAYIIAAALISIGLMASTWHLGQPLRAWRAFSQWRTSWLSREGVIAVFSFVPLGLLILLEWRDINVGRDFVSLGMVLCIHLTIHCTAMIYASLRPIHAWYHWLVPVGYQVYAIIGGGMVFVVCDMMAGITQNTIMMGLLGILAVGWWHRHAYHLHLMHDDTQTNPKNAVNALGLGERGITSVRKLEQPGGANQYLCKEMGYVVARRHAQFLARMCLVLLIFVPVCTIIMVALGAMGFLLWGALISAAIGLALERWLFFARAKHRVMLYYHPVSVQ
ncbi:MAG: DmsC/YnfH family molybdoenzyme membrane anchor subunit [Pseudomonadota bacterium]